MLRLNNSDGGKHGKTDATSAADVQAVVTSFNQGKMVEEAVRSLWRQTTPPSRIILVDDGSTDPFSLAVLERLAAYTESPVPVTVLRQPNGGVSSARNAGIREAQAPFVLVLDGDDRLEPTYIEQVGTLLRKNEAMVAASSWMHTFGVLDALVRPTGGGLAAFLPRNACPATHLLRRKAWERAGGYDETMRSGFEDWDFFLCLLETDPDATIGIVRQPLLDYRTAPASANVQSMTKRLRILEYIINKHGDSYRRHLTEALLGMESTSMSRLDGWEREMSSRRIAGVPLCEESEEFLRSPSYGDGGMAAAVRIVSQKGKALS